MEIVSFSGKIGSGKDLSFDCLAELYDNLGLTCKRISFADPLKDCCSVLCGWDRKRLDHDFEYKEGNTLDDGSIDPACEKYGMTRRQFMQQWGTDINRDKFHWDIWVFALEAAIRNGKYRDVDIGVITDARFINELEFVKSQGGRTLRIDRRDIGGNPVESSGASHVSEQEWMKWDKWDSVIENIVDAGKSHEDNLRQLGEQLLEDAKANDPLKAKIEAASK